MPKSKSVKLGEHAPSSTDAARGGTPPAKSSPTALAGGGKWTPQIGIHVALAALQALHLEALTTGEGRGYSTEQMAAFLDGALGYSELYAALVSLLAAWREESQQFIDEFCQGEGDINDLEQNPAVIAARAALAKARGETDAG